MKQMGNNENSSTENLSMAENKEAFLAKCAKNKANFDLHKSLIKKHFEGWKGAKAESLLEYIKTGKVTDYLHLALMQYAEEYAEKINDANRALNLPLSKK